MKRFLEEIMDEKELVCLNDLSGTRVTLAKGTESAIELSLVSQSLAGRASWEVGKESTIGSDHYPIYIGVEREGVQDEREGRWKFRNANWECKVQNDKGS